jgi:hypothetical protein
MSITPGWIDAEDSTDPRGHCPQGNMLMGNGENYFLDNGGEYKKYPRTQAGWEELCDDLKGFAP